jgi:UDP-N-acetylglucosamine 2-epimerase (non-hydrolysing)
MKIISVVGARPNFMKMAPVHKAFKKRSEECCLKLVQHLICHTGQHYDKNMSKVFFDDLELPKPDFYLSVGSGSHAEQTAKVMIEFEKVLINEKPDLIIVYGDVNSTVACSLVAAKMGIKVAHVESGLRSFDRTMPEEINRIITDHIANYLFVTEKSGLLNLKNEGIADDKIFFVGNTMIDSLVAYLPRIDKSNILSDFSLSPFDFILVTLHRPSNVDEKEKLEKIIDILNELSDRRKIIFPVHPRTRDMINTLDFSINNNLILTKPIGYIDFLALMKNAELIITDSGGIQEESTFLGVQCITLRDNTERPSTVEVGTNVLCGTDLSNLQKAISDLNNGNQKNGNIPELWDGKAAERIADIILN